MALRGGGNTDQHDPPLCLQRSVNLAVGRPPPWNGLKAKRAPDARLFVLTHGLVGDP
jgi:hypothetical protein